MITSFLHANRGTLMVLKRLIFAALGLVGMLGFGTAMGQGAGTTTTDGMGEGGIPAPKFYGDITLCAGGTLPAASTAMGTASLLGMGGLLDQAFDSDTGTDGIQMDYTADLAAITTGTGEERDGLLALLNPTTDADCANDVARGYTMAVELYDEYVRTKGLAESRTATDADRTAFTAAMQDKDAYGGDVYDQVYNQRMREEAARKAITDYNALVGTTGRLAVLGTGDTGRGYSEITVNDFVTVVDAANPTDEETRQLNRVYGSMGIRGYQAIAGTGAVLDADGAITRTAAFNTPGVLQTGMSADATITTLGGIAAELALWETAVSTASSNLNAANEAGNLDTRALEETLRKVTAGRDHVSSELNRLTSIVRNQNRETGYEEGGANRFTIGTGTNAVTYTSERQVVDAYLAAQRQVTTAATNVRSAVKALDDANKALMRELGSADSYLSQLVSLRKYEQGAREKELAEAGGANASQTFRDAVEEAKKAVTAAEMLQTTHTNLTGDGDSPGSALLSALLESDADKEDDGLALVNAVSGVHDATMDNKGEIDSLKNQLTDADGNPIDLTNLGDTEAVEQNASDIETLDGRVTDNEADIDQINMDLYGTTSSQQSDASACAEGAGGLLNTANCADARSRHNAEDIADLGSDIEGLGGRVDDNEMKLMQKKEYIDNLAAEIGVDPVTGMGTEDNGMSRIDNNESRSMANETAIGVNKGMIETNAGMIATNAGNIKTNADNIMAEQTARMEADTMLGGRIDAEASARMDADMMLASGIDANKATGMANMEAIGMNKASIDANAGRIGENAAAIGANRSSIMQNADSINGLQDQMEVVRAGVAASMALAGMPAVNGRGIAIGVGSYDGESAFAVGFQIQGEQASFKIGVTSSGGETGASAGVGFQF